MSDKADDDKPVKKKVADPAIRCLATCDEAIALLEQPEQDRVMHWLVDKYGPAYEVAK